MRKLYNGNITSYTLLLLSDGIHSHNLVTSTSVLLRVQVLGCGISWEQKYRHLFIIYGAYSVIYGAYSA